MNKIIAFICCLVLCKTTFAQKDSLAFDDSGKYIYYKVVSMEGLTSDTLYKRSLRFFQKESARKDFKIISNDVGAATISCAGFFLAYKPSLAKHPDGQIAYTLKLEIKNSRYRYWLSDFVYKPYYRDRYNNYVPDPGIEVPLEKGSKSISETDLNKYLSQSATFARLFGGKLKEATTVHPGRKIKPDTIRRVHIDKSF